jgi:hypothetical protein
MSGGVPDDYECGQCGRRGDEGQWQPRETGEMVLWQCPTRGCQHTYTEWK